MSEPDDKRDTSLASDGRFEEMLKRVNYAPGMLLGIEAIDRILVKEEPVKPDAKFLERLLIAIWGTKGSELRSLWEESDSFEEWHKEVLELRARLVACV